MSGETQAFALALVVLVLAALLGLVLWGDVIVWRECRAAEHSVWYCLRVLR